MSTTVLVTGAAGYIGSILCERLLDAGHRVVALDNLMYGEQNLFHLCADPRFEVVRGDARDERVVRDLAKDADVLVPLAGSTESSSVPLVPESHRWKESEIERTLDGARTNGQSYTVPAVVGAKRELRLVRPNPGTNEVLVFSPYLIHGGGGNRNPDQTRVSLELRFWRRGGPRIRRDLAAAGAE